MLSYDRQIRPELEAALMPDGPAHGLVVRHESDALRLDLHLRAYPHRARNWVSLYCGLTKPLDLLETNGKFRLYTDPTWRKFAPGLPWNEPLALDALRKIWPAVEDYLDNVLPAIEGSRWFKGEGVQQTALTRLTHEGLVVFDREACPSFTDTLARETVMAEEAKKLTEGLASSEKWWVLPRLGDECDAAALDRHGRFLAIEVKPASASAKSIAWAPLQAAFYARLFMRWIDSDTTHANAIDGLIAQRTRIGLSPADCQVAARPLTVVPVVIIGGGLPSKEVLRRCRAVRGEILARGLVKELQLWSMTESSLVSLS